jgi:iron-sulfur cluster repair protein YtfE (RIC family)
MRGEPRPASLQKTEEATMATTTHETEMARDEHARLREDVEQIRLAARELSTVSPEERHLIVGRILDFLRGTLLPYAEQEEDWLYPVVGQILGNAQSTGPMTHDHIAIRARVIELGLTEDTDLDRLQELLYGLYTLIAVHFWKEEQLYLPLLERPNWPVFDG